MVRIVLDANQFISALLKPGSNPDLIMRLVRREKVLLLLSDAICAELLRVLTYPKIRNRLNRSEESLTEFIDKLRAVAVVIPGAVKLPPLQSDPSDTKYLECAVEGKARLYHLRRPSSDRPEYVPGDKDRCPGHFPDTS